MQLHAILNPPQMPEPVHLALYTKPISVSVGPVNCFRQICCGIVPAVSSRADYQNPEPEKAENPFIEERQLMVMSFSDPIKALSTITFCFQ